MRETPPRMARLIMLVALGATCAHPSRSFADSIKAEVAVPASSSASAAPESAVRAGAARAPSEGDGREPTPEDETSAGRARRADRARDRDGWGPAMGGVEVEATGAPAATGHRSPALPAARPEASSAGSPRASSGDGAEGTRRAAPTGTGTTDAATSAVGGGVGSNPPVRPEMDMPASMPRETGDGGALGVSSPFAAGGAMPSHRAVVTSPGSGPADGSGSAVPGVTDQTLLARAIQDDGDSRLLPILPATPAASSQPAVWDARANIGSLIGSSIDAELQRGLLHGMAGGVAASTFSAASMDASSFGDHVHVPSIAASQVVTTPEPAPIVLVAVVGWVAWRRRGRGTGLG